MAKAKATRTRRKSPLRVRRNGAASGAKTIEQPRAAKAKKARKRSAAAARTQPHETELRRQLAEFLTGEQAHAGFRKTVAGWPEQQRGVRPAGAPHTPWQLLEHMRIAQRDILHFTLDPQHVSPEWPDEYWPKTETPAAGEWERSVAGFERDLQRLRQLALDANQDLSRPIAHGSGQTLWRELLLAGDHNSHHLGQLILLRRLQGSWK